MSRKMVEALFFPYADNGRKGGYVTVFME